MRVLVVATNAAVPTSIVDEIRHGQHYHIDYLELVQRFPAECVDYSAISNRRLPRWVEEKLRLDLRLALRVAQIAREQRYDVVISMSERVGIPLCYTLDRSIKQVVILHHPLSPIKLRLMQRLGASQRWSLAITISRAEAIALSEALHLEFNRVKVLNTPVDTEFFQPIEQVSPSPEPDHVQSLGLSYRDYLTLIRAMRMLPHIPCHLRAGSAWVQGKAGYEHETIPNNIHIKPYVHPSILRDCLAKSRFVVIPLRRTTQWSAGCTSVQLAQAMGKAVIATALPGLSDYVQDHETGLLIEGGDPVILAEAIGDLWNNPEKVEAMGRRAREWVHATFSLDKWLDDMTNLVRSLVL